MGKDRPVAAPPCVCEEQRVERDIHAQKMEALGILAGGMAHDMNNVLASIMAVASAMEAEMGPTERYWGDVQDILSACRRGAALARNLLGFARKNRINNATFNLNDTVREVEGILSRTAPSTVSIALDLAEDLQSVAADQDQLRVCESFSVIKG
jgi:signal transduction histidine kinase